MQQERSHKMEKLDEFEIYLQSTKIKLHNIESDLRRCKFNDMAECVSEARIKLYFLQQQREKEIKQTG